MQARCRQFDPDYLHQIMFELRTKTRSCGGCTRCCEGWLTGDAWGHQFHPGKPCGWLCRSGCLIYENRPRNPCQTFLCEWKRLPSIPEWMRPQESGVILVSRRLDEYSYIRAHACGRPVGAEVLTWAQEYSDQHQVPVIVDADTGVWCFSRESGFRIAAANLWNLVN